MSVSKKKRPKKTRTLTSRFKEPEISLADASSDTNPTVIVVGGGLAGMAAAASLAKRGFAVQLLESRPRLGGRASSFEDRATSTIIDNCQHVSMQCCTNFAQFSRELDFDDCFEIERELLFVAPPPQMPSSSSDEETPNAKVKIARFSSSRLPAPLHLATSLWRQSWLTWREKFRIALAMRRLSRCRVEKDEPFLDWLIRNKQSENAQRCFWHVVMVSALSETLDRISLRHARKVFVDGFLCNRKGWEVAIPKVPLDEIYESRIRSALQRMGVELQVKAGVERIQIADGRVSEVRLRSGQMLTADFVVCAVPQFSLAGLIPQMAGRPEVVQASQLETAPISSVHLWFDREITPLKHAVFVDRLSHWVFNRSKCGSLGRDHKPDDAHKQWYYQVVISAARELEGMTEVDVLDRVEAELKATWPAGRAAVRLHGRQITEHKAVFAPTPGVDEKRLCQVTDIPNLFFAGDWTQTGWPATMEGAVRSGYLAAEGVLDASQQPESLLAQPLPVSWLYRWLY